MTVKSPSLVIAVAITVLTLIAAAASFSPLGGNLLGGKQQTHESTWSDGH